MPKQNVNTKRRKDSSRSFRKGQQVVLRSDPDGKVGIFHSGPPVVIENTHGQFPPLKLKNKVLVAWKINGKEHICISNFDEIELKRTKNDQRRKRDQRG